MGARENCCPDFCPGSKKEVFAFWIGLTLVDYAVAGRGFVFGYGFFFFHKDRAECAVKYSAGGWPGYGWALRSWGYANTGDDGTRFRILGFGYMASDLYANASFWSSFTDKTLQNRPRAGPARPNREKSTHSICGATAKIC